MSPWNSCKNILCVRLDNMGDVVMSEPAIRAVKNHFHCKITLLTSSMGKAVAPLLECIDETIVWDVPWVKNEVTDPHDFMSTVELLKNKRFDGAILFTVFSQNPLPAATALMLAGIPRRLAYCRENPYGLLTDWVPDKEPYSCIHHQVKRDLFLLKKIGIEWTNDRIHLRVSDQLNDVAESKLQAAGVDITKSWVILHPGVSEEKRRYPKRSWIQLAAKMANELSSQVIITGGTSERDLAEQIALSAGPGVYPVAGMFSIEEFVFAIRRADLIVSVNTSTIHFAAAMQTKIVVLYALTNPQHLPWKGVGKALPFSVTKGLQSKNEILQFVHQRFFEKKIAPPEPHEVFNAVKTVMQETFQDVFPELLLLPSTHVLMESEVL